MIGVCYQWPVIMTSRLAVVATCVRAYRLNGSLVSSFFSLCLFSLFFVCYATA